MSLRLTDAELKEISRRAIQQMVDDKVVTRIMEGTYVPHKNDDLKELLRKATNEQYRKDRKLEDDFKRAYIQSQGKYVAPRWTEIPKLLLKHKWLVLVSLFLLFCVGYTFTEVYIGFMYGVY